MNSLLEYSKILNIWAKGGQAKRQTYISASVERAQPTSLLTGKKESKKMSQPQSDQTSILLRTGDRSSHFQKENKSGERAAVLQRETVQYPSQRGSDIAALMS